MRNRSERISFWAATFGLGVLAAIYYAFDPASGRLFFACPFHRWTGLYCAGCGGQRAAHALLHGRLADAVSLNALAVFAVAPAAGYGYLAWALRVLGAARLPYPALTGRRMAWLICAALVFGVLRNMPLAPLAWFAP